MHLCVGEHLRLENVAGISQLHANLDGARLRIDRGIDEGDISRVSLAGIVTQSKSNALANANIGYFVFINVGQSPDTRQIGDCIDLGVRRDRSLRIGLAISDESADRRRDRKRVDGLAALIDLTDLLLGNIPIAKPRIQAGIARLARSL